MVGLALYVCLKNICDGVGGQDESNGTPLDPPLFWLDNIFKLILRLKNNRCDKKYILLTNMVYWKKIFPRKMV